MAYNEDAQLMTVIINGETVWRPIDSYSTLQCRYEPVLRRGEMYVWQIGSLEPIIIKDTAFD